MPYDDRCLYSPHIYNLSNDNQQARTHRTFLKSIHKVPYIAVVDESYREPVAHKEGQTTQGFYTLTATVISNKNFPILRERFLDITSYWHSNEAGKTKFEHQAKFNSGNWRGNILPMAEVARAHSETNLVTVHAKIPYSIQAADLNHHVENARKECITTMTKILTNNPKMPPPAVIFESRRNGAEDHHDRATLTALKKAGIIGENFKYTFTSSSIEPVLWAADVGAWLVQRHVRHDDPSWLKQSCLKVQWFDAQSGQQINTPQSIKPTKYIEFGRIKREIEDGENLKEHQATLEKAAQGILDNKINTGISGTSTLFNLSREITRHTISPRQAHDLEIGRGAKSAPQRVAAHLLKLLENKNQELANEPEQALTQKIQELKQQTKERQQQQTTADPSTIDNTNHHIRNNPDQSPQRGPRLE